jgi:hypothetical protein
MSKVRIGGKERTFSLDFASFRVAEKRHGQRIRADEFGDIGLGDFARYLWVGLLAGDHALTEDEVLKWLSDCSPEEHKALFQSVMEGIESFGSLFEDQDLGEAQPPAGQPSTGGESSLSVPDF